MREERRRPALPEIAQEVRERADIVEAVSRYVELKQAGKNFRGLCPFHPERNPSFYVSPDKQFFYCFGCGVGGDVINFLMRIEGLSFPEALRRLAEEVGVQIPLSGVSQEEEERRERLFRINEAASSYYHRLLLDHPDAEHARLHLDERGLGEEAVRRFKLGYAPRAFDALLTHLDALGFDPEEALRAGLVRRREDGSYYDLFRDRLTFPIFDLGGRVVGFGARALVEDEEIPKYINTPETEIFKKGLLLYGLHLAKEAFRERGEAVLVEGYTDVITSHLHGERNVVASLGTSLTEGQVRLLRRFCRRAILAYDADSAGLRAALRAGVLFEEVGIEALVVPLPKGSDPDEIIRFEGVSGWRKRLSMAEPLLSYRLKLALSIYDLSTEAGRLAAMNAVAEALADVASTVVVEEKIREMARMLSDGDPAREERVERALHDSVNYLRRRTESLMPRVKGAAREIASSAGAAIDEAIRDMARKLSEGDLRIERRVADMLWVEVRRLGRETPERAISPRMAQEPQDSSSKGEFPSVRLAQQRAEEILIQALLSMPSERRKMVLELSPEEFSLPLHRRVFETALSLTERGKEPTFNAVSSKLAGDEEVSNLLARLALQVERFPLTEKAVEDCIKRVKDLHKMRRLEELRRELIEGRLGRNDPRYGEFLKLQQYFKGPKEGTSHGKRWKEEKEEEEASGDPARGAKDTPDRNRAGGE